MFKGIKNQFLAKLQVEKFICFHYVKFIIEVEKLLRSEKSKQEILFDIMNIKDQIIKKFNLTEKDLNNEK